ncbi:MAG: hypothetical protein ABIS29_01825 [Vicinamibacterales bacterium]
MNLPWLPLIGFLLASQQAGPPAAPVPRVAFEDSAQIDPARLRQESAGVSLAIAVRVQVPAAAVAGAELADRLASYRRAGVPLWLTVHAPGSVPDAEAWRRSLATMLQEHGDGIVIVEIAVGREQAALGVFAVKLAATEARSARPSIRIALGGSLVDDAAGLSSVYTEDLAPYIDLLVVSDGAAGEARRLLARVDPNAALAIAGNPPDAAPGTNHQRVMDFLIDDLGTDVSIRAWRAADPAAALRALAPAAALLTADITRLDAAATKLRLSIGGRDVTDSYRFRMLFDERTFATYLVYWGDATPDLLHVAATLAVGGTPVVRDLLRGSRVPASNYTRDEVTGSVQLQVPLTGGPMVLDFNEGATEVFAARSGVSASRELSVAEIIARHQEQERAQDFAIRNYSADARMEQHFRATMADAGYDVVTENRYYASGSEIEWEELSFSVNGAKWGADRPPFPVLQAEKVLSLPLQLRFDTDYRYDLRRTERVDEFDCYVIDFEPVASGKALYRGTVWIDRSTFARVRVQIVQSGLPAPVVSNEETQHFTPVATLGGRPLFVFTRMSARQILMVAGRNVLVEKSVEFTNVQVNRADFTAARDRARASNRVMYKETDQGLRHYIKEGEVRVISTRPSSSVKAMAIGVTIDPSYGFPLPIFGINYLDFEFGDPDTQLALLFGGVLAAGNIQRPKLGSTPLDVSVDFFGIAAPSSDRIFGPEGEREDQRVLTWPLSTGVNLGWQYTAFQKALFQYQFRFDGYVRDRTTAEGFEPPPSTITNGFGGAWEYRRGGYSLVTNATWYRRRSGEQPAYTKYTASISRDWYFRALHKIHLNGAWFGGQRLDRFSKYQFGMFDDTRIHGVPASGVRFRELTMARGSYSFNLLDLYRLDLFLEQAWGRDRDVSQAWRGVTGVGAAANLRVRWNMILRAEAGKSFLPSGYRDVGSTTFQILLLKPLR